MSKTQEELLALLKEPFDAREVHWRVGARTKDKSKGIALAYINSRDVMKRLDDVMGIAGWQSHYPEHGICELMLLIEGKWISKSNTAGETSVEGMKGQGSDALKRAATCFGVGRYLYYLPNNWVALKNDGRDFVSQPVLPNWALPKVKEAA